MVFPQGRMLPGPQWGRSWASDPWLPTAADRSGGQGRAKPSKERSGSGARSGPNYN